MPERKIEEVHRHLADTMTAVGDVLATPGHGPGDVADLTLVARHLSAAHAALITISQRRRRSRNPSTRPLPKVPRPSK